MKNDHTLSQLERTLSKGWAINVYNYDQRLLFALKPSHGWVMLAGAIMGMFMVVLSINLRAPDSVVSPVREHTTTITPPLQVD
ncbi:MAG: hypothetical protein F6K42_31195 [Leptolyngbya sp. SIO1D8]|nr:hypothetical protein [Leptolyngbya sp. SIO1D8]